VAEPTMYPCLIMTDAAEVRERDGGYIESRRWWIISRRVDLPFVPIEGKRPICGLFPNGTEFCYGGSDPDQEGDDDEFGLRPISAVWNLNLGLFVVRLGVELHLPWGCESDRLPELYPGWTFVFDAKRTREEGVGALNPGDN
jgi:hypothetical protein